MIGQYLCRIRVSHMEIFPPQLPLFYKTDIKWFPVQDTVIQTLGLLFDFRKTKKHSPSGSCFFTLFESPACLDHSILHGKPFGISLIIHFYVHLVSKQYASKPITSIWPLVNSVIPQFKALNCNMLKKKKKTFRGFQMSRKCGLQIPPILFFSYIKF